MKEEKKEIIKKENNKNKEVLIQDKNMEIESIETVKKQIDLVRDLYKSILIKDQHYGKIPGTNKDTLYKAGAEKLTVLFRLVPKVEKEIIENLSAEHREYKLTIGLYHKNTGECWGQSVGSCSTMESKYRYRNKEENTGIKVDKAYWDLRNANNLNKYYEKYPERKNFSTKKIDGIWIFIKKEGKIENENIADVYNTVYKMAYKRAFVGAVIIATGVSDIFTQDLEESLDNNVNDEIKDVTPKKENNQWQGLEKIEGQEQKNEIIKLAEKYIQQIKEDNKFDYFKELRLSKENYSEDQYLLDLQYLQGLEKDPEFNDEHMKEGIFDKFKGKNKLNGIEDEVKNENFGDR